MPSWTAQAYALFHRCRQQVTALTVTVPPVPSEFAAVGVRRVLLVCTGLMGDTLMCLPAMASARDLFPDSEVVGLVTEGAKSLLQLSGRFDRFIVTDGAPLSFRPGRRQSNAVLEARLASEAFDVAVIFLGDDYAPMLTRAGIPWRVFVYETPYRRLATRSYRTGGARTWGPSERLDAWRALGLDPRPSPVTLIPPPAAAREVNLLLHSFREPIVVLHPFGRTPEQRWPEPPWRALASLIRQDLGGTAILIGDASRAAAAEDALAVMGRLPMCTLVALFQRAQCIVSTDSGPFHLAGVMGRPGVGLFRASRPEHASRYASVEPIIGTADPACSALCSWARCRKLPCVQMASIPSTTVFEVVRRKVSAAGYAGRESGTQRP